MTGAGLLNPDLRAQLLEIGNAGISAADPAMAIKASIRADDTAVYIGDERLFWDDIDRKSVV